MIPVLTLDGPSGVGKGTIASIVARKLDWHLLDSGAIYRAFAITVIYHVYSGLICGNNNTSLIEGELVKNITNRSTPIPSPAVGGMPYSRARI